MMPKTIRVTIDRLVLQGYPAPRREAIAAALVAQLERELSQPGQAGALGASRSAERLKAAPLRLSSGASAKQIGVAAGQGLAGSLCK